VMAFTKHPAMLTDLKENPPIVTCGNAIPKE